MCQKEYRVIYCTKDVYRYVLVIPNLLSISFVYDILLWYILKNKVSCIRLMYDVTFWRIRKVIFNTKRDLESPSQGSVTFSQYCRLIMLPLFKWSNYTEQRMYPLTSNFHNSQSSLWILKMLSAINPAIISERNWKHHEVSALRIGVIRSAKMHRCRIQSHSWIFSKAFMGIFKT